MRSSMPGVNSIHVDIFMAINHEISNYSSMVTEAI